MQSWTYKPCSTIGLEVAMRRCTTSKTTLTDQRNKQCGRPLEYLQNPLILNVRGKLECDLPFDFHSSFRNFPQSWDVYGNVEVRDVNWSIGSPWIWQTGDRSSSFWPACACVKTEMRSYNVLEEIPPTCIGKCSLWIQKSSSSANSGTKHSKH